MIEQDVQNPHDQFVRSMFSNIETARNFLENYMPPENVNDLNFDSLEVQSESFIDDELRSHHTDLLYNLNLKTGENALIYVLLEHKSYADESVAFQILRYKTRIWEKAHREKSKKLPLIFPLVLYHGAAKWKTSRQFANLVERGETKIWKKFTAHFEYHLCDLSGFTKDEIKGSLIVRAILYLLQNIRADDFPEKFHEFIILIAEMPRQGVLEFLEKVLRYVSAAKAKITVKEIRKEFNQTFPEDEGELYKMYFYEEFELAMEKGRQLGLQQAVQQNAEKTKTEVAATFSMRLLRKKFGVDLSFADSQIRSLPLEKIEELGEDLLDFDKVDDLTAWLERNAN
ncbi:MAG: Rpn family recombination-promoting nuclease/putative transposase [Pyrinomonadaceae bacterium]|nr:Rpn family recombination-promoting nuclease/putative transposase [Pyrinomonadaceae bacterium]